MTSYLSHKLTILYTLLILMVVYIHSYYVEAHNYPRILFLQRLTGMGICRLANCLFFYLSGYLFARSINNLTEVYGKVRKRMRTLLVPYILWNIIFILWYIALDFIPDISEFNNGSSILDKLLHQSILETLYDFFIKPAAFHLWFLRDLLIMVLFTPVLWYLTNYSWKISLLIAVISVAIYPWLIYFWVGMITAIRHWNLENYPYIPTVFGICCSLFLSYAVYVAIGGSTNQWIEMTINFIGIYCLWCLYDVIANGRCCADKGVWKYICGYGFFIYCFHEPTFNIIKKIALTIFGTSETVLIVFYYINPLLIVGVSIIIAKSIQHYLPLIYNVLTGGR